MVERFQQQQLASSQVGLPREDKSLSTAAAIVAQTANQQRDAVLQQASQQFAQADSNFSQLSRNAAILEYVMNQARAQEKQALLSQDVANKKQTLSMQLRDLERATKLDYIANPQAGVKAFHDGAVALAESMMPTKGKPVVLGEYGKAFNGELAQASERILNWQGEQERETVNAAIKENQKQFLLAAGQEANPDVAIDMFLKYSSYLHTSGPRMSPGQHLEAQNTIRQGLTDFVKTVAKQNPARIEEAITIAKGLVPGAPTPDGQIQRWGNPAITEEDAEGFRDMARQTTKRIQAEAVDQEKNILEKAENELDNSTTVTVQRALAARDIQHPNGGQIAALRNAALEVDKHIPVLQQQFREVSSQLNADPQNLVLLARQNSLNKQIKLLETKHTQLDNAADSVAKSIETKQQIEASRAQAAAARELASEARASREEEKAREAQLNVEIAQLSGKGVTSSQVAAKANELSTQLQPMVKQLNDAKAALEKNPNDKKLQNQLQVIRQEVNSVADKVVKLNSHAETMLNREIHAEDMEEKNKAKSRLDLMKANSVTGDVKAGLEARIAMPWIKSKNGKLALSEIANYSEAQASLRALEEGIGDAYKAGILTASERDTLSARNQKNMAELQQIDKPFVEFPKLFGSLTDAINKPINDMERKGILPPPGTPQYKAFVGRIEKNTTDTINQIYASKVNPWQYIHENGKVLADAIMQDSLEASK